MLITLSSLYRSYLSYAYLDDKPQEEDKLIGMVQGHIDAYGVG